MTHLCGTKMAKLLHLDQMNESSDSNSTHTVTDNMYIRKATDSEIQVDSCDQSLERGHVFAASPQPSSSLDKPAGTTRTTSEEF